MVTQTDRALLDWLDGEADDFSAATTREYYLNYAGLKDDLALAPIFERYRDLFDRDTVGKVLAAEQDDERLPHLRHFVVEGYLEQAAATQTEAIAARETTDTVEWDGEALPYRAVQQRVMNEPDAARRRDLDARRRAATAAQNELRESRWETLYARARELGFESYAALCERAGSLPLAPLRDLMTRFLAETERPYHARLERELRAIGVDPAETERADLLRLFRSPDYDAAFPRDGMLPALEATLADLGIDEQAKARVRLDTEERPRKTPRAFCAPVQVPDEIYLVISPHGGYDDYRALFHEAGHSQHFAHIRRDLPFAFRGLGDNSVTEGFAFVLEHLLYNKSWLQRHIALGDAEGYLSFVRFNKLYMLRRYAAKLLYELELHATDGTAEFAPRYADLLSRHLGARHFPEDYLNDLDDGFYCARYLRAWIFEAQVRDVFVRRWGEAWYADPAAAATLKELWSHGQRYDVEGLLSQLGEPGLRIDPLAAELSET